MRRPVSEKYIANIKERMNRLHASYNSPYKLLKYRNKLSTSSARAIPVKVTIIATGKTLLYCSAMKAAIAMNCHKSTITKILDQNLLVLSKENFF